MSFVRIEESSLHCFDEINATVFRRDRWFLVQLHEGQPCNDTVLAIIEKRFRDIYSDDLPTIVVTGEGGPVYVWM